MSTELQSKIEELVKQIGKEPDNATLFDRLAEEYRKAENYDKMLENSCRAIKLAPENPDVLSSHGNALAWMGKYEEAIKYHAKAIEHEPANAKYYYEIGLSYGRAGNWEKSHENHRKAFELKPENNLYLCEFAITAMEINIYFGIDAKESISEELFSSSIEKIKIVREKRYLPIVRISDDLKLNPYEVCFSIDGKCIFHRESDKKSFEKTLFEGIDFLEKLYARNII